MLVTFWAGALVWSSSAFGAAGAAGPAPAVEPTEWLNTASSTSWHGLKGRLVLVEKWATW